MDIIEFTGYEPKPVMAQKMAILVEEIRQLRKEIDKLKTSAEPAKKPTKAKIEEQ